MKNYDYGHPHFTPYAGTFTQMIWKSTTTLGVGIAYRPDSKKTYIVALYQPGGNLLSVQAYKENVLLPLAGCKSSTSLLLWHSRHFVSLLCYYEIFVGFFVFVY